MKTIRLRVNAPLRNKRAGEEVVCEIDAHGVIIDSYWRARLEDAKTDNCVTFLSEKKKGAE